MTGVYHIPALLNETIDALNIKSDGIYVDATFGGGGHSRAIFERLTSGKLIAFDQDIDAATNAWEADNFILVHANFSFIRNFTEYLGIDKVDGIIADLGLSTHHLDMPERGFSFRFDAVLDMRMNTEKQLDAKFVLNNYDEQQLADVFYYYGELRNARKIASTVVNCRKNKAIETTFEFVECLKNLIPKKNENKFLAQVFQAVRIEVNDEINTLKTFIEQATDLLTKGGRFAIISYHSLEDKLVKNFFKNGNFEGKRLTDMYGNQIRPLKPINNKVIVPSDEEIRQNNRARSAKLRIAEKL